MIDLPDMARKLRRDAGRRSRELQGAERRLDHYKLVLSVARHGDPAALARAEQSMRATFGDSFVDGHSLFRAGSDPVDKWHLTASWTRMTEPSDAAHMLLGQMLLALGIPEDARHGEHKDAVDYGNGTVSAATTHWMWAEPADGAAEQQAISADSP
jgi:hypothetical protein